MSKPNALIVHGGAPTAVINASLYGAVQEMKKFGEVEHFYAAIGGTGGILKEHFLDLMSVSQAEIDRLPETPASAIGTSRDPLEPADYQTIAGVVDRYGIQYIFMNGGNGTMDTCGKIYQACKAIGKEIHVVGIPKTIDNDIAVTDHAPGYGSAARYIAETAREIGCDLRSLPIHVCILETMGRNSGWIAAASALASDEGGIGPDLIYLPEKPFDTEQFLQAVETVYRKKGYALVVVCEGLCKQDGTHIVDPIFQSGRSAYYGDVNSHLVELVIRELGIKARGEKPGICGRTSIACQSPVDRYEAELAGREAVRAALNGQNGVMVGFRRISDSPYRVETIHIPIEQVMLNERMMPEHYINPHGDGVTSAFLNWCRPLLGGELRRFASL